MNRAAVPPIPPHLNLTGRTLGGRYRIERPTGVGGMAHVYLAHDAGTDGEVAIKVLLPQLVGDAASAERLRREAVIAMRLDHPNVCRILDVGETPELPIYLVMPYLRGEELAIRQLCRGPLPVHEGIPLLLQICRGLHAHGLQILHRDLKPENVMLVPDSGVAGGVRAVVMDFGFATVLDEPGLGRLTPAGMSLGTPEFISPEQVVGRPLGARSDVYAVGLIAFEMFTGCLPFEGTNAQEVAIAGSSGSRCDCGPCGPSCPRSWRA